MLKKITVFGMTCENSRKTLIHELQKIEGISCVDVYLPTSIIEVEFNETIITIDLIKKHVQELGYDPI